MRLFRLNKYNPKDTVYFIDGDEILEGVVLTVTLRLCQPTEYEVIFPAVNREPIIVQEHELFSSKFSATLYTGRLP